MRIEAHLNCFGYFGFGGGWDIGNSGRDPDGKEIYCNRCPLKEGCWERHLERVRKLFPEASKAFAAIVDECDGNGQVAVQRYSELYDSFPPELVANVGNIEDGSRVALGVGPIDRGPYSLRFPFPVAAQA